ncbi:hypothetical protein FOA52_012169 [Chlamydomonas sp. UWO 241]|nr:hypothetical protein FOA52_012169 [Chlamydomonas sp. UWO 241]
MSAPAADDTFEDEAWDCASPLPSSARPSPTIAAHYGGASPARPGSAAPRARPASPAGAVVRGRPQSARPYSGGSQRVGLEHEVLLLRKELDESRLANKEMRVRNSKLSEQVSEMQRYARERMASKHLIAWSTLDRVNTFEKMEHMEAQLGSALKENVMLRMRLREAGLPDRWTAPRCGASQPLPPPHPAGL